MSGHKGQTPKVWAGHLLLTSSAGSSIGSKQTPCSLLPPQSGASSFGEKFSRVKFSPSLTLFGGKPMEGWIAVTVSGLVTVSLLKPSGQVLTSTESLCRLRGRVALADIAFTGGGNIVVATADGSSASPVQFYKVCVSVVSEKCRIDTEILPSLFMRCTTDLNRKDKFPAITHLKFLARDMSEQVSPAPGPLPWPHAPPREFWGPGSDVGLTPPPGAPGSPVSPSSGFPRRPVLGSRPLLILTASSVGSARVSASDPLPHPRGDLVRTPGPTACGSRDQDGDVSGAVVQRSPRVPV